MLVEPGSNANKQLLTCRENLVEDCAYLVWQSHGVAISTSGLKVSRGEVLKIMAS